VSFKIQLEAMIEGVWRYAHGGHDGANLEAIIECVCRYTLGPGSNEWGDALGGSDQVRLEIFTWRPMGTGRP